MLNKVSAACDALRTRNIVIVLQNYKFTPCEPPHSGCGKLYSTLVAHKREDNMLPML